MNAVQRGMIFGASSIILFFLSFGIGIREKSKITTILLIAGGAVTGTSVLGAVAIGKGGLTAIQSFVLSCSNSGICHNGTRYTKIGSEKMNTLN